MKFDTRFFRSGGVSLQQIHLALRSRSKENTGFRLRIYEWLSRADLVTCHVRGGRLILEKKDILVGLITHHGATWRWEGVTCGACRVATKRKKSRNKIIILLVSFLNALRVELVLLVTAESAVVTENKTLNQLVFNRRLLAFHMICFFKHKHRFLDISSAVHHSARYHHWRGSTC